MRETAVFHYDVGSPWCWLAGERVTHVLGLVPVWQPVLAAGLPGAGAAAPVDRPAVDAAAAAQGLPPPRWPEPFPFDSELAMRAATFAKQIGKVVSFSLAAFRQAYAAGRDLTDPDNVMLAAAACELHPNALTKAVQTQGVKDALREATEEAAARGVIGVPTVVVGDQAYWGDDRLGEAAQAARG
jgi:2-hydroxychromene-2-carboxylate isomerase